MYPNSTDETTNQNTNTRKSLSSRQMTQFTTFDAFGLAPESESITYSSKNDQKRATPYSRKPPIKHSIDEGALRSLNAVRMKINMANAIVQNAAENAKVPMTPEERKREMLQLEAAKLIIFVGRHFNVREELQNVIGNAFDERDAFRQLSNTNGTEALFVAKEAPPDLSIKELRRVAAEMETLLEQEKLARCKTGKEAQLSSNKVSSNLTELLWIIESLELEMPASQYSDLGEETAIASLSTIKTSGLIGQMLKEREEQKQQQQQQQQPSLPHKQVLAQIPQNMRPLSPLASELTRMSIGSYSLQASAEDSQMGIDKEDKWAAFSVDNESAVYTTPEAAKLKLLQFMYDAVTQNGDFSGMPSSKGEHSRQDFEEEEGIPGGTGIDRTASASHSTRNRGPHKTSTLKKPPPEKFPFHIPWHEKHASMFPVIDDDEAKRNEEDDDEMQYLRDDTTGNTSSCQMSGSTIQSATAESPVPGPWMQPPPSVRVQPMRPDLIEILQKLYETFNYDYHFRQCRTERDSALEKSPVDYAGEMQKLLAQQKQGRLRRAEKSADDDDIFSSWRGKNQSTTGGELLRRQSSLKKLVSTEEVPESDTLAEEKESPPEELPVEETPLPSPSQGFDETILLSAEVGDGLLFVVKGRKEKGVAAQVKQRKRGSSVLGEGRRKKTGKDKNSAVNNTGINSVIGNRGKKEKQKGRLESVSLPSVDTTATNPKTEFNSYTLYAMNESNKPVAGVVHIDMQKIQNLRLRALLSYSVDKKTILVRLPPHNNKAVLTLQPIKKGKEVGFKDALYFEKETAQTEPQAASKGADKRKPSTMRSTGTLYSTSSTTNSEAKKVLEGTKTSTTETLEKDSDVADTSGAVSGKSHPPLGKVPSGGDTQHSISYPEKNLGGIKGAKISKGDADDDHSDNAKTSTHKGAYRKSSVNLPFPGRIGFEVNWDSVIGSGVQEDGSFNYDLISEGDGVGDEPGTWDVDDVRKLKEDTKSEEVRPKSSRVTKRISSLRGEADNLNAHEEDVNASKDYVNVNKQGGRSEVKKTDTAHAVSGSTKHGVLSNVEVDGSSPTVTPVSEWGKPLKDQNEEALERDRVVLSVLRSSSWCPDAAGAAISAARRTSEDEKMDAVVDEALNDFGSSPSLQRDSSGRAESEHKSAEEIVANFLHNISGKEQLNLKYIQSDSTTSEDGLPSIDAGDHSLRVGSATSNRQVAQTEGAKAEDFFPSELNQQEEWQQTSRATSAMETRSVSGVDLSSSDTRRHLTTTGKIFSTEEAQVMRLDGHRYSTDTLGSSNGLCETCAGTYPHASDSAHIKSTDDITGVIRQSSRRTSGAQWESGKGSTIVVTETEKVSEKLVDIRPIEEKPLTPTQPRLPYNISRVKSVAQRQPSRDLKPAVSYKEEREYVLPREEEPLVPSQMRVYTELRPGGRVAFLVPEKMGAVAIPFSTGATGARAVNQVTASEPIRPSLSSVETFAKSIQTSLHTNARQIVAHGRSGITSKEEFIYGQAREKPQRTKSVDAIRYAALPPLSLLYTSDTAQPVDDMDAAEEEARTLFMRDPARYDCVVDDLVSRALAKIKKEEAQKASLVQETGTAAAEVPQGTLPSSREFVHIHRELDSHLEQQLRARRIIAYILLEMRRMWRKREMEVNIALRIAVDRHIHRACRLAWRVERRRVLGLRAMLNVLDRITGRRRGWIPPIPTTVGNNKSVKYAKEKEGDGLMVEEWKRSLWRPPMCLAHPQRILPIQVVQKQSAGDPSSRAEQHVLFGYKRTMLEPHVTPALRMRYERRTRRVAPFQRPTMRFSPQEERLDGTPKV